MYECLEAEEALVSCLISDPESVENVYGMLSPEMFESSILGKMFYEYRKAFDEKKKLTMIELHQIMANDFKDYEISDAFGRCVKADAFPFQIRNFAEVIVKHYKASCISAMLSRTEINEADVDKQIEKMIRELQLLQDGENSDAQTVAEITGRFKDKFGKEKEKPLVEFYISDIDEMVGGLAGGDVCICAARPAVGKSAFAAQLAETMANKGMKVGYYNLEMTSENMYLRFCAAKSGIDIPRIRRALKFNEDEQQRYDKANEELLKQTNLYISSGAKRVSEIRADQRKMKFDVLFVDYLQLVISDNTYQGNRQAEVSDVSRQFKAIAIDFDIPVILLAQLNRVSESKQGREPAMSELRESGSLEQDASVVVLMWNKDENDNTRKGLKIAKSRNGKTGRCDMVFDGSRLSFIPEADEAPFGA